MSSAVRSDVGWSLTNCHLPMVKHSPYPAITYHPGTMTTTVPKPRALVGSPAAGPGAGRNPGPLVSAAWVNEHLGDEDLRIVHVAPNRRVYNKRHLPGATYSDLHAELALRGTAPETGDAEREWLVPTREQAERPSEMAGGRGRPARAVRRRRAQPPGDPRLLAAADVRLPGDRIHIMDGGIEAWRRAGFETTTDVPEPDLADGRRPPVELGERDDSFLATYEEVVDWSREASKPDGPTRILDVRTAGEFVGTDLRARRGGHIPGAQQRCFVDLLTDEGTFRPVDEMLALIRAIGVELDEVRATYCQGGVRAALVWFVLRELAGYEDVRAMRARGRSGGTAPTARSSEPRAPQAAAAAASRRDPNPATASAPAEANASRLAPYIARAIPASSEMRPISGG